MISFANKKELAFWLCEHSNDYSKTNPRIAFALLDCSTVLDESASIPHYRAGKLNYRLGNYEKAVGNFQAALALCSDHGDTVASLAKSLIKIERFDAAFELLRENRNHLQLASQHANLYLIAFALSNQEALTPEAHIAFRSASKSIAAETLMLSGALQREFVSEFEKECAARPGGCTINVKSIVSGLINQC